MNDQTKPLGDTAIAAGKSDRFPSQIKYIVGNEACERFSYYGMVGILELYLAERMSMGSEGATETLHLFGADRKSTRLNSSHESVSRMPSSA